MMNILREGLIVTKFQISKLSLLYLMSGTHTVKHHLYNPWYKLGTKIVMI